MAVLPFRTPHNDFLKFVQSSRVRKANTELRLKCYQDEQADDLLHLIKEKWQPDTVKSFRMVFVNVLKKIIDKTASTYSRAPRRTFEGWDQQAGEALYDRLKVNVLMKRASRMTKLCRTAAIQVLHTDEGLRLCLYTPNILDAEWTFPDTPSRMVVTHHAERVEGTTYSDWSAFAFNRRDARGNIISTTPNPYEVLPFVPLFDRYPDSEFFLPGGDDLIEAQRSINVALANIWRATELQAHGQPVVTGYLNNPSDRFNIGPDVVVSLPEGSTFDFVAPNAPVPEMLEAIEFLMRQTCVANNLSADVFDLSNKAESGSAKLIEGVDLIEERRDQAELWRSYEAQLFEVIKTVQNTHEPGSIPDGARLVTDFVDPDRFVSEQDRLEGYRSRMDLGLWSPVDALLADNPDIRTREDAMNILNERREESAVLGTPFVNEPFEEAENE